MAEQKSDMWTGHPPPKLHLQCYSRLLRTTGSRLSSVSDEMHESMYCIIISFPIYDLVLYTYEKALYKSTSIIIMIPPRRELKTQAKITKTVTWLIWRICYTYTNCIMAELVLNALYKIYPLSTYTFYQYYLQSSVSYKQSRGRQRLTEQQATYLLSNYNMYILYCLVFNRLYSHDRQ